MYSLTVLYIRFLNLEEFVLRAFLKSPVFLSLSLAYIWVSLQLTPIGNNTARILSVKTIKPAIYPEMHI